MHCSAGNFSPPRDGASPRGLLAGCLLFLSAVLLAQMSERQVWGGCWLAAFAVVGAVGSKRDGDDGPPQLPGHDREQAMDPDRPQRWTEGLPLQWLRAPCNLHAVLWEQSPDGLRLTDERGFIVAVNRVYCEMAGWRREDLLGQPFSCVYPPEQRERVMGRYLADLAQGGPNRSVEKAWVRPDGSRIWIEAHIARVSHQGGAFVLATFRDATRRKQLEKELERKLAEGRAFFNSTSVGLAILDAEGRFTAANHSLCRLLGEQANSLEGRKLDEFVDGETAPRVPPAAAAGEDGPAVNARLCRPKNTPEGRRVFLEISPMADACGQAGQALVAVDLSRSWQLEHDLLLEDRIDAALVEGIEGLAKTGADEEGWTENILRVLETLATAFETDRASWYAYDLAKGHCRLMLEWEHESIRAAAQMPVEMPLEMVKAWATALERDGHIVIEDTSRVLDPDLRSRCERRQIRSMVSVPIADATGQCRGWLALHAVRKRRSFMPHAVQRLRTVARAINALQQLQQTRWKLEQARGELHTALAVAERRREEAEQAQRTKSEFLAMVSHEIRTPLNGVLGVLSLLNASETLTAETRQLVTAAQDGAKVLMKLLGDLIDLSRLEAAPIELQVGDISPFEICEDVLAAVSPAASKKGLAVVSRIDSRLPAQIRADGVRLRQILLNLLGNAVKFTQHGGVLLQVSPQWAEGRHAVVFTVEDTGIGIAEGEQQRIFDSFYRGSQVKQGSAGWGLGLAISQRMAAKMGAWIELSSRPGGGSRFSLILPSPTDQAVSVAPQRPLRDMRILLLDENSFRAEAIAGQLLDWGAVVLRQLEPACACNAVIATRDWLLAQGNPDAALNELKHRSEKVAVIVPLTEATAVGSGENGASRVVRLIEPLKWILVLSWLSNTNCEQTLASTPETAENQAQTPAKTRVLVADDNALNRQVAEALLRRLGCEVKAVADGERALAELEAFRPDLVLLDLEMPVLNGEQTVRRIRSLRRPMLPVLALSAHVLPEEIERALQAGFDGFLPKPVGLAELQKALSRWVTNHQPES